MNRTIALALAALISTGAAGFAKTMESGRDIAESGMNTPAVFGTAVTVATWDYFVPADRVYAGDTITVQRAQAQKSKAPYGNDLR
jgi:hypothetical protein